MHMCEFLISHLICRKILCASGRKHWSVKSTTLYVSLYILLDSACFRNLNVTCSNTSLTRPHPLTIFIISMPLRIYQHTLVLLLLGFKSGCLDMLFFLCIKSSFLDVLHFSLLIFTIHSFKMTPSSTHLYSLHFTLLFFQTCWISLLIFFFVLFIFIFTLLDLDSYHFWHQFDYSRKLFHICDTLFSHMSLPAGLI